MKTTPWDRILFVMRRRAWLVSIFGVAILVLSLVAAGCGSTTPKTTATTKAKRPRRRTVEIVKGRLMITEPLAAITPGKGIDRTLDWFRIRTFGIVCHESARFSSPAKRGKRGEGREDCRVSNRLLNRVFHAGKIHRQGAKDAKEQEKTENWKRTGKGETNRKRCQELFLDRPAWMRETVRPSRSFKRSQGFPKIPGI